MVDAPSRATSSRRAVHDAPRAIAARVLVRVLRHGQSLAAALPLAVQRLSPRERALASALCYGVLRWYARLDAVARRLLHNPLKDKDQDVYCLMLAGLYQLIALDLPSYAAVDETVEAARALGKPWASGLVNAVLRTFQRQGTRLLGEVQRQDEEAATAHPRWLLEELREAWPADWRAVVEAGNQHAPMSLRVNARQTDRAAYLSVLSQAGVRAKPAEHAPQGAVLDEPMDVDRLPGFDTGRVSVQDGGAQLAAPLLGAAPGERVLDACAAPGGKACHLLETVPCELWALDISAERLQQVRDNLERLGLDAHLVAGDATRPEAWWDGMPYDRILLDAPCSSTGVIRRHPDIKWLRRPADIPAFAALQARLLVALWPLLKPAGTLLYCTCSVLPAENEQVVSAFLAAHADALESTPRVGWGRALAVGRQVLPGDHDMDGFYYARLDKTGLET